MTQEEINQTRYECEIIADWLLQSGEDTSLWCNDAMSNITDPDYAVNMVRDSLLELPIETDIVSDEIGPRLIREAVRTMMFSFAMKWHKQQERDCDNFTN